MAYTSESSAQLETLYPTCYPLGMLKATALSILLTQALTFGCETVCVCNDDSQEHFATAHQMDTHDGRGDTENARSDHDHKSESTGDRLECAMTACLSLTESGTAVGTIALEFVSNNQMSNNQLDFLSMIPPDPPPPRFS